MSNKKCASCSNQLALDEGYWHESYQKDICNDCYYNEVDTCQLCGNEGLMPSQVSPFILVKCELGQTCDRPPGIYRVLQYPFLSIPMIGSARMDSGDVCFTERLPKRESEYKISGHVCIKCSRPYARRFTEVYGRLTKFKSYTLRWGGYGWWLQREHVRRTVLANPEMLYDFECEPDDYVWKDFFKHFRLPSMRTWRDWLALDYLGVKVYFTSEYTGSYGEGRWERLALSPDPKYRQMAYRAQQHPMLVYPHELPAAKTMRPKYQWGNPSVEQLRLAVMNSILVGINWTSKGAIRQSGLIL